MCGKEQVYDYCYFLDLDLVKLYIDVVWKECIKVLILELFDECKVCYIVDYGLFNYDVEVIILFKVVVDFFEDSLKYMQDVKVVFNWIMGDLFGYLNNSNLELFQVFLMGQGFGEMIGLLEKGMISSKIVKIVFKEMLESGKFLQQIVEEKGFV